MGAATRRAIVAMAMAGALALVVSGCGGADSATAGKDAARHRLAAIRASEQARAVAAGRECERQLGDLLHSLDFVRSRVTIGVAYGQYLGEVRDLKATYDRIHVPKLGPACLARVGIHSEKAVNKYLDAVNIWGACREKAGCRAYSVAQKIKPKWWAASDFLSAAHRGLKELQAPR
jgi:hypothetical protein